MIGTMRCEQRWAWLLGWAWLCGGGCYLEFHPAPAVSYQVRGEVDKVCVVFVDELHHGALESTKICIQVLSETLDSDPLSALADEFVHVKVSVQERIGGEA